MTESVLNIAAAFDAGNPARARDLLLSGDFRDVPAPARRILLSLWRRSFAAAAAAGEISQVQQKRLDPLFDRLDAAQTKADFWPVLKEIDEVATRLDHPVLAAILRDTLWDALIGAPFGFQYQILTQAFLSGDNLSFQRLFEHLLAGDPDFVPDYWQAQSLFRSWTETGDLPLSEALAALLKRTGRGELTTLCRVYLLFSSQTDMRDGFALAETLTDPVQKARMAVYLTGASQTEDTLPLAVALHRHLTGEGDAQARALMSARLAIATGDWADAKALTEGLIQHPEFKHEAICLRALALVHLGDDDNARAAIDHVRFNPRIKWFLKARADLVNVARRLALEGTPQPNDIPAPALSATAGKPLAQSLWIGPRLRWIEEMSIRSYLANGWRYQLYTYEPPENVPDGVEVMDASAILPRSEIFVEGANSGMHKGSVGAFSDLFRYALIAQRGGMWTDTDVINLRKFEPDGARFISTERSDAGLIGLNGAMMAAPAHDTLQTTALRRARELVDQGGLHFARIGPELLAELIGDGGTQGYRLLPTSFLNPIGWMETGKLLRPFDEVRALPVLAEAANIHVYTETWRLVGLSLTAPPTDNSFLALLHDRLMNAAPGQAVPVRQLMQGAA